ncbi:hypothetical protein F5B17DRAFT_309351 [Nemania serpens]|nr:hypothetical protein F5B17DRAFT_309351 [Nemania serpens]
MSDRAPPPHIRPGASRLTRAATGAAGAAGVRRNLFQSQLTRRPTPAETTRPGGGGPASTAAPTSSMSTMSTTTSAEPMRVDADVLSESSEIVVRDKNGEFEVEDPPTPPMDEPDDEAALDDAQENEKERQRLAEAVRLLQMHTHVPAQQEEVLEIVRASMRAKVAALAEDNWMYEAEEPPHVH